MDERNRLAEPFEANRNHLRAVAYRMLGSLSEAEDAVQEAWLRLSRADTGGVENLGGWLTTVVARICLDVLRARRSRREEPLGAQPEPTVGLADPEQEALLADSVGIALLVILQTLEPAERLAFVLHDMFALPFEEIAPIVGRSATAARQLASRARRRIQGAAPLPDLARDLARDLAPDLARQREVVDAYLAAARGGDLERLLAVLDPDVVLRADPSVLPPGAATEIRSARNVAERALKHRAQFAQPALVDGAVGLIVAPRGHLSLVLAFKITNQKITEIDVIADPARLSQLDLGVL